jgi:adenylate cyclase
MQLPFRALIGRAALPLGAAAALIFAAILVATSAAIVGVNHVQLTRVAEREAREDFDTLAAAIRAEVGSASRGAATLLGAMSATVASQSFSELEPLLVRLLQGLEDAVPAASGLFIGFPDGRHIEVERLSGDLPAAVKALAGPGAAFAAMLVEPGREGASLRWRILDGAGQPLGETEPDRTSFDPRARPWFGLASAAPGMAATEPYRFANVAETGITLAQRSERLPGAVLGLDITLADLDAFLARHREPPSLAPVIFAQDGTLVAHPEGARFRSGGQAGAEAGAPLLEAMRRASAAGTGRDTELTVAGTRYFARFETGGELLKGYVIGAAVPYDAMLGDAERIRSGLLLTSVVGILCALLVVLLAARALARPLHRATNELGRVTRLEFGGRGLDRSRIREVRDLWAALETLELALQNFVRYVPFGVVQGLVRRTFSPRLGGIRQPVTVLFSDIAGFTQIAETLDPEDLTARTSTYFSAVGEELVRTGATIDKYIGDSIMAFWNAPEPQEHHAALACLGALRAARRVDALNAELVRDGFPPLRTRFGIHTGEAVVGNVGSVDRMNYTALGHTVNLASRLEGMNKRYGTTILVSGAVRQAVGDRCRFRFVDRAVPQGASEPVELYELLGDMDEVEGAGLHNTSETVRA